MKKILYGLLILPMLVLVLVGCTNKGPNVVISKVYGAREFDNNLIELYNNSDKDVSLKKFKLNFYNNGSEEVTNTITLTGDIKANDYFVISGSDFMLNEYKDKIDFTHDQILPFNGDDVIELAYKNKRFDLVGVVGVDVSFSTNQTLIRLGNKEDYKPEKTYDHFKFISYLPDLFDLLKTDNHEIKLLEDLLRGPRLESRYKEMDYTLENGTTGAGGAFEVTLASIADGDTASFRAKGDIPRGYNNNQSVRYYYINTPEVNGGNVNAQPWGYVASKYNKEYLLNDAGNKELFIQSIPNSTTTDTYSRNLGLVWVNDQLSQFLIIAEGLTIDVGSNYDEATLGLSYKNVPYLTFLRFAEQNARTNGWGMHGYPSNPNGEKSPDWNYSANKLATMNPVWTPHLPINWEDK